MFKKPPPPRGPPPGRAPLIQPSHPNSKHSLRSAAPPTSALAPKVPKRWRPERAPVTSGRQAIGRARARGPQRMSQTAGRMLGLMSVMMGGRAMGMTTGQFTQHNADIQTGMDGTIRTLTNYISNNYLRLREINHSL